MSKFALQGEDRVYVPVVTYDPTSEPDAILSNIELWEEIVQLHENDEGRVGKTFYGQNDFLCRFHNNTYEKECTGCAVRLKTGHPYCRFTPAKMYGDAVDGFIEKDSPKLLKLVRRQVEFLKSLLHQESFECIDTEIPL